MRDIRCIAAMMKPSVATRCCRSDAPARRRGHADMRRERAAIDMRNERRWAAAQVMRITRRRQEPPPFRIRSRLLAAALRIFPRSAAKRRTTQLRRPRAVSKARIVTTMPRAQLTTMPPRFFKHYQLP